MKRTKSTQRSPFGRQPSKTKRWDHTAFSKSGLRKGKAKEKRKANDGDERDEADEAIEFEQFPAPFVSGQPFKWFAGQSGV
jgi:ATP-dependent DNA helicase MPH1